MYHCYQYLPSSPVSIGNKLTMEVDAIGNNLTLVWTVKIDDHKTEVIDGCTDKECKYILQHHNEVMCD